jgi:hypothetical protein
MLELDIVPGAAFKSALVEVKLSTIFCLLAEAIRAR